MKENRQNFQQKKREEIFYPLRRGSAVGKEKFVEGLALKKHKYGFNRVTRA